MSLDHVTHLCGVNVRILFIEKFAFVEGEDTGHHSHTGASQQELFWEGVVERTVSGDLGNLPIAKVFQGIMSITELIQRRCQSSTWEIMSITLS